MVPLPRYVASMVVDDFSAHAVPISPAATVMILSNKPDLRVLMVERTANLAFAPAAWVFPGGRVDHEDHSPNLLAACEGRTDAQASKEMEMESEGLAWWIAACRETLEEAGVLLGTSAHPIDLGFASRKVRTSVSAFGRLVDQYGIKLDVGGIEEVARFITPLGPPRRFDARFFMAQMPEGQDPQHEEGEVVGWDWIQPIEALERHNKGEFEMISPTVRMLACLARFETAEAAMAVAAANQPYQRVRVVDPQGEYHVVLPGDDGYESAELEVESGWVRLY